MSVWITSVSMALCLTAGTVQVKGGNTNMGTHATGTFEVKVEPVPETTSTFPRMSLHKRFSGDLEGTSEGEMMSVQGEVKGSGAYVAIERFSGTLAGRTGSFALVHSGTMQQGGNFDLTIKVVPDSGAGELAGISGAMEIILEGGGHAYDLGYTLPVVPSESPGP